MLSVLSWWIAVEVIGLLALPLTLRLLRHLPDRGYGVAKPLGLLLTGYLLWIGATFGLLSNSRSAILFAMLILGVASAVCWWRDREDMTSFLRANIRWIIAVELVFSVAFLGWAVVRAYNPDIAGTEKPMEIGFLNAILRSDRFPPHDPWLSGFAISYYYFGYLMIALLTKLTGVAASIAFNLAIALLFALTATGAFSLVYNLVATDMGRRAKRGLSAMLWSLLGPLFVVVIGNLEGFFEVLHTRGVGSPAFWQWLDVEGLITAPTNGRWVPTDTWWWWRASRVINDRDLNGVHMEVIDEFPQFSFLLGDMHPHVLNLPFVFLALALALNVLLGARAWAKLPRRRRTPVKQDAPARWPWLTQAWELLSHLWHAHTFDLLFLAVCLGALGFLNTWDLPIYLLVLVVAFYVGQRLAKSADALLRSVLFGGSVALPAAVLYLPFYLGFQSQAGGVLPVLLNTTRLNQYLLMFGLFIFVIVSLVVTQIWRAYRASREQGGFWRGFLMETGNWLLWVITGPILVMALVVLSIMVTSRGRQFLQGLLNDERVKQLIGSSGVGGLLRQSLVMRLGNFGTFLLVALLLAVLLYLLQRAWTQRGEDKAPEPQPALAFVYIVAGVGLVLTLAVEFVYLRDIFGTRMNTVFKFYYQAWALMAAAAAFGAYYLLGRPAQDEESKPSPARYAWLVAFVLLVGAGMLYPLLGIPNKCGDFRAKPTLDGMAFLKSARPDDYAAIQWLQEHAPRMAYIAEAYGGSYSDSAFVSAFTGLPTILGWDFHEDQWRGNDIEPGKRRPDVEQIYKNQDSKQVLDLLDKYGVRYLYVGPIEQRKFEMASSGLKRYERFLEKVFEQGSVTIYQR